MERYRGPQRRPASGGAGRVRVVRAAGVGGAGRIAAALACLAVVAGCSDGRPEPVSVPAASTPAPAETSATSPTSPAAPAATTETGTWDPATATSTRRPPAATTGAATTGAATAGASTTGLPTSAASGTAGDAIAHCTTDRLAFSVAGSSGAAGTINVGVRVTNTGPGPCWTYGYPGLELRDEARRALPTFTLRGAAAARFQRPAVAKLPPRRVSLALGEWGWFDLTYTSVPSPACPEGPKIASELSIIAPDDTESRVLRLSTAACHGDLAVSPILAASTWTPMGGA